MSSFPLMSMIRQAPRGPSVPDVVTEVNTQLDVLQLHKKIQPGETVAITAGSRGIDQIDTILRVVVAHLASLGAKPFLVAAMGSHGGATAAGQREVLASLNLTESSVGCPIQVDMKTIELGMTNDGFPVHFDRTAYDADHVFVCNRVRPHTIFKGATQSGLLKMLVTGMGNLAGAQIYHRAAVDFGYDRVAEKAVPLIFDQVRVAGGLAIVENSEGHTALLEAVMPEQFFDRDRALLQQATDWMGQLPFDEAHLLIVDEIGKHISGTGMDSNIIGRKTYNHAAAEDDLVNIRRIALRSVIGGNATGIGCAEFCLARAVEATDKQITWLNNITANRPQLGTIPPTFEHDREMLEAALSTIGLTAAEDAKILWIKNTKEITSTAVSSAYLDEIQSRDDLTVASEPFALPFDGAGDLPASVLDVDLPL